MTHWFCRNLRTKYSIISRIMGRKTSWKAISKVYTGHSKRSASADLFFICGNLRGLLSGTGVFQLWKYVHIGLTKTVQSAILCLSIENCESIEARYTSVCQSRGTGIPIGRKGKSPKQTLSPGQICWFVRKDLPDCHESGALSFLNNDDCPLPWMLERSGIHGFLFGKEKGRELWEDWVEPWCCWLW